MSKENYFTIRVYGVWINEKSEVLVSDEYIGGMYITKFPGGGLEFGEGIHECLKREWMEEIGCGLNILKHIYTTDFFQISAFNPNAQVISVYYLVESEKIPQNIKIKTNPFDFDELYDGVQSFRFIPIKELNHEHFTLPIDKLIPKMI